VNSKKSPALQRANTPRTYPKSREKGKKRWQKDLEDQIKAMQKNYRTSCEEDVAGQKKKEIGNRSKNKGKKK